MFEDVNTKNYPCHALFSLRIKIYNRNLSQNQRGWDRVNNCISIFEDSFVFVFELQSLFSKAFERDLTRVGVKNP